MYNKYLILVAIIASLTMFSCNKSEYSMYVLDDGYGCFYLDSITPSNYIFKNGYFEIYLSRNYRTFKNIPLKNSHRHKYEFCFEFKYMPKCNEPRTVRLPQMEKHGVTIRLVSCDVPGYER